MRISDWSSDVCSSDLHFRLLFRSIISEGAHGPRRPAPRADPSFAAEHLAFGRDEQFDRLSVAVLALDFIERASVRLSGDLLRSEEHTSELQSLMRIPYAVFCLKKKTTTFI